MVDITAERDRKRLVKHQIKALLGSLPICADGDGRACLDCESEALSEVIVTFIVTGELAQ